jgi:hypothetical protein
MIAAVIPFLDFEVNALGRLNLLEAARGFCPESPFIHMSANKVYGDRPNTLPLAELETRWDYAEPAFEHGVAEDFSIDQSKHSIFVASKIAADVMVQEYGRYFGMLLPARRMPHRPESFRRRVARIPQLSGEMQRGGARVQGLRIQRQVGARQHPFRGCGQLHV